MGAKKPSAGWLPATYKSLTLRCIDAIKLIKKDPGVDDAIEFAKLDKTSIEAFALLEAEFHAMWPKPPLFMPASDEDPKRPFLNS